MLLVVRHADSPIGAVADMSRSIQPAVAVLLSMNPAGFLNHAGEIEQLADQAQVLLAGAGATPETARRTRSRALDQDPVSAAGLVDAGHPRR